MSIYTCIFCIVISVIVSVAYIKSFEFFEMKLSKIVTEKVAHRLTMSVQLATLILCLVFLAHMLV